MKAKSEKHRKAKWIVVLFIVLILFAVCWKAYDYPGRVAAIHIANQHWLRETGEAMDKDHPLEVFSNDDTWLVTIRLPRNTVGGGPTVQINKKTGKVVKSYMTQ